MDGAQNCYVPTKRGMRGKGCFGHPKNWCVEIPTMANLRFRGGAVTRKSCSACKGAVGVLGVRPVPGGGGGRLSGGLRAKHGKFRFAGTTCRPQLRACQELPGISRGRNLLPRISRGLAQTQRGGGRMERGKAARIMGCYSRGHNILTRGGDSDSSLT